MKEGKPGQRMRWHVIADRCPKAEVGVEVGVLYGTLSKNLLRIIPTLALYMVDRWAEYPEESKLSTSRVTRQPQQWFEDAFETCKENVRPYGSRAVILQTDSASAGNLVLAPVDFVFIDADHTYDGVIEDINIWSPKVKKGGWLIGHDYGSARHEDVKRAVDDVFGSRVEVDADHTWCVQL